MSFLAEYKTSISEKFCCIGPFSCVSIYLLKNYKRVAKELTHKTPWEQTIVQQS